MRFGSSFAELKKNTKNRTAFLKELELLNREEISAGIHKKEGAMPIDEKGTKLIDIAVQNEYGNSWSMPKTVRFQKGGKWFVIKEGTTITIPATRFIGRIIQNPHEKETLFLHAKAYLEIFLSKANRFGEYKAKDAVKDIGKCMADRIKSSITRKEFQPNAPLTTEAKGFNKRLFDKGLLYESIKFSSKKSKVNG